MHNHLVDLQARYYMLPRSIVHPEHLTLMPSLEAAGYRDLDVNCKGGEDDSVHEA